MKSLTNPWETLKQLIVNCYSGIRDTVGFKSFESNGECYESYDTAIAKLTEAYRNIGSDAESVSKILKSMATTSYETEYINKTMLYTLEDQLEPCPACGCKPRVQVTKSYTFDIGEQTRYDVGCPNRCGQIRSSLNLVCLIESWNRYACQTVTRPIIKPKTTNCPNCGAPVDIHAEKCAYCDTPYI